MGTKALVSVEEAAGDEAADGDGVLEAPGGGRSEGKRLVLDSEGIETESDRLETESEDNDNEVRLRLGTEMRVVIPRSVDGSVGKEVKLSEVGRLTVTEGRSTDGVMETRVGRPSVPIVESRFVALSDGNPIEGRDVVGSVRDGRVTLGRVTLGSAVVGRLTPKEGRLVLGKVMLGKVTLGKLVGSVGRAVNCDKIELSALGTLAVGFARMLLTTLTRLDAGTSTLGILMFGTLTLGTVMLGTVTLGKLTLGTLTLGTLTLGTLTLGTLMLGRLTLAVGIAPVTPPTKEDRAPVGCPRMLLRSLKSELAGTVAGRFVNCDRIDETAFGRSVVRGMSVGVVRPDVRPLMMDEAPIGRPDVRPPMIEDKSAETGRVVGTVGNRELAPPRIDETAPGSCVVTGKLEGIRVGNGKFPPAR